MITVVADFRAGEGKAEQFIQAALPMIRASRKEEGCVAYGLYRQKGDDGALTFIERWKDQAAIDFHFKTPHFQQGVAALKELGEEKGIRIFEEVE
jgi:quinol monooxygenase YgiN